MGTVGERGFALLVVLWSLVLISLLTMQIVASGRSAVELAANVRAGMEAQARADGAINEALFHLFASGTEHWPADGTVHILNAADGPISVRVSLLDDKINPNLASTGLLAGLLEACGASKPQALKLAGAIVQWRSAAVSQHAEQVALAQYRESGLAYGPSGQPFADLSDLRSIIGMPPALLAAALPHMSLYQPFAPDPAFSDAVVRQALKFSGQPGSNTSVYLGAPPVVLIAADVAGPGPGTTHRIAVVSIVAGSVPYQFLSLADGD